MVLRQGATSATREPSMSQRKVTKAPLDQQDILFTNPVSHGTVTPRLFFPEFELSPYPIIHF